jgi:putative Mg2+ transporter-C (MgtC) family protein
VIVFELVGEAEPRRAMGSTPLREEDGVASVWNRVAAEVKLRARDVRRVYSEWQLSPADEKFLAATFPAGIEAKVAPTPSGTIGISYVMKASAPDDLDEAWGLAVENAGRGLKVNATATGDGTVFSLERAEGMATSILADPGFLKQASAWMGTAKFHIGVPDLDHLLIWNPASSAAGSLEGKVLSHRQPGAVNMDPVVLRVDAGGPFLIRASCTFMYVAAMESVQTIGALLRFDLGLKLLVAVIAGGAIGFERQVAGKPAGLRTNILICIGSAILMDLSIAIGVSFGPERIGDPARLAAQVVTGIGFLGAGTIMQAGKTITGLTSAATIWVVAAIGLATGAGFYIEALGGTLTVMVVLAGLSPLEHRLLRVKRRMEATVRTRPGVTFEWVRDRLWQDGIEILDHKVFDHPNDRVFEMRLRGPARQFEIARTEVATEPEILTVFFD